MILEWEYYPSQCIFTVIFTRKDGGPEEKKRLSRRVIGWEVMTIKHING